MEDENNGNLSWIGWIVIFIIVFILVSKIFPSCKYEGENAEFWFNAYDQQVANNEKLKECIQDYPHNAEEECF